MTRARTGERAYFTQEWHGKTFSAQVGADGEWIAPQLFVEQGGEALAVDGDGNVYIADGHIHVYDPKGRLIEIVQVPERPHGLTFGGEDGRTLFICAGTSLYAARIASHVGGSDKGRE
jgi:sugar lactone lactonase YvrE